MLRIRLLGEFAVELDSVPLNAIRSPRLQSLLAYLLLHRGVPGSRAHLAFRLWSDSSEAQAQANLRYFLHQLRRALPDPDRFLEADKSTLLWRADAPYTFDVAEFEQALTQADQADPEPSLKQAIRLYAGDLLPACYDDWIIPERERLRDMQSRALECVAELDEQRGDYASAIDYVQRLLRQDPLRESAYRQFMRLHIYNGDRAGALRAFQTCVTVLKRELDVEPSPATRETYQRLMQAEVPARAPTPAPSATPAHSSLPYQSTSFIGRERELAEVRSLLARTRLLTLTGAGGSGKTRLVLALAEELAEARVHADGVGWVELAAVSDPALVPQAVASALHLTEQPGQPLSETIAGFLGAKKFLLMLDNSEHVVEACAHLVGILLRSCPRLSIVVTSRNPLGLGGEVTWVTPPLSLPEHSALDTQNLIHSEAVRLFAERAATTLPTFRLSERNAALVAHICRRLDGIPLAIELAAARIKLMTVEQIAAHLDDALHLLRGRNRSGPPRHQTLQAAIDWSYQLLSAGERILFRRLSVFAGGFTLEEAEEVASGKGQGARGSESWTNDLPRADVLDLLSQLIDQSLVMVAQHEHAVEARYRLLETIRQYAKAKLQVSGEMAAVRQQHADFFVRMAEATWQTYKGREEVEWIERMEREHDNFRTALEWAVEEKQSALGLRLAGAIWRFWYVRGYLSESRDWLTRLMALPDVSIYTPEYAAASYGAGVIAWRQGDHTEARALGERALQLYRILEDGEGIGLCLIGLANVIGAGGDYQAQRTYLEEGLALFRELDDKSGMAGALNNLGELARLEGDVGGAEPYYAESLALYQSLGNSDGTALVQHNLAQVALHKGDTARAATLLRDSLSAHNALGHRSGIAMCLAAVAGLAAAQGQAMQAARLSGAAEGLRKAIGVTMDGADATAHDHYLALARSQLDEQAFASAWAEGQAMFSDQAVGAALAALDSAGAGALS